MSSDSDEELEGVEEQTRKAQLIKNINQLLLQNGLSVTAAALRKECEKLWRKKDSKTNKKWWTMDENWDDVKSGSRNKLEELLASAKGKNDITDGGHSDNEADEATTTITSLTQTRPKGAIKSMKNSSTTPLPAGSSTAKIRCPFPSKRNIKVSESLQSEMAVASVARKHRQPLNNLNNKKQRSLPVPQNSRQNRSNMDTEEEIGGGGGKDMPLLQKKAASECNLSQSPPADPIRARPSMDHGCNSDNLLLMFDTDKNEPKINSIKEDKTTEAEQWLCARLDYRAVGLALLKCVTPNRESALLVQALRQQLTKVGSLEVGATNLGKMIANDIFMLRSRKQSVLSLFLCPAQQCSSNLAIVGRHPHLHHSISSTSLISNSSSTSAAVDSLPSSVPTFLDLFKDQLGRLLNVVTSFRHGRDYMLSVGNGRQFLYEIALALRTKRVRGATVDHLLAALQKLSIKPSVQKELILNGMMEWLCRWLSQAGQSLSGLEYGTALLHNLCLCPISHQTTLRHKDDLVATVLLLIGQAKSAQLFHYSCATLYVLLAMPRVRASARERGGAERVLNECVHRTNATCTSGCVMQLTEQQRQQLTALLHMLKTSGVVEPEGSASNKKRIQLAEYFCEKAEDNEQTFPDYLEAEIDSTDPLVPSLNELFGYELLCRRFLLPDSSDSPLLVSVVMPSLRRSIGQAQFAYIEDDRESIPGVVPVPRSPARPVVDHAALQKLTAVDAQKRQKKMRTIQSSLPITQKVPTGRTNVDKKEIIEQRHPPLAHHLMYLERSNSMSSHSTFVVENNARRPLLVANGFSSLVALMRNNIGGGDQWQRINHEQKKTTGIDQLEFVNLEIAGPSETAVEAAGKGGQEKNMMTNMKKFNSKLAKKTAESGSRWARWQQKDSSEQQRPIGTTKIKTGDNSNQKLKQENSSSYNEYLNVFASRPKVSRTPPVKVQQKQ